MSWPREFEKNKVAQNRTPAQKAKYKASMLFIMTLLKKITITILLLIFELH